MPVSQPSAPSLQALPFGTPPGLRTPPAGMGLSRGSFTNQGTDSLTFVKQLTHKVSDTHGRLPSMKWLARKTGDTRSYRFIYHATSRHVHFSTGELLRHAWVSRAGASIRTVHFRSYWENFALSWGLRLFLDSTIQLVGNIGTLEAQLDSDKILAAAEWIGEFGQVPIITARELAWPTGPISS